MRDNRFLFWCLVTVTWFLLLAVPLVEVKLKPHGPPRTVTVLSVHQLAWETLLAGYLAVIPLELVFFSIHFVIAWLPWRLLFAVDRWLLQRGNPAIANQFVTNKRSRRHCQTLCR